MQKRLKTRGKSMVHVVGDKIGMRMEVLFPLVRNLSTTGILDCPSRFHDPTWLLQNPLLRFSPTDSKTHS